jgi:hypothetical protein
MFACIEKSMKRHWKLFPSNMLFLCGRSEIVEIGNSSLKYAQESLLGKLSFIVFLVFTQALSFWTITSVSSVLNSHTDFLKCMPSYSYP